MTGLGQTRTSSLGAARPLPPSADIGPGGQSVGQAAQFCLEGRFPWLRAAGLQRVSGRGSELRDQLRPDRHRPDE